jgi:hypothetical protein
MKNPELSSSAQLAQIAQLAQLTKFTTLFAGDIREDAEVHGHSGGAQKSFQHGPEYQDHRRCVRAEAPRLFRIH